MARAPPNRRSKNLKKTHQKKKAQKSAVKNPNICRKCKTHHTTLGAMWECNHGATKLGTDVKSLKKNKTAETSSEVSMNVEWLIPKPGGKVVKKAQKTNSLKK